MTELQNAVIEYIKAILSESSFKEHFYELVVKRLASLGYEVKEDDGFALTYAIQKVENHVFMVCNINKVPEQLYNTVCDMVCGEFLNQMYSLGKLDDIQIEQTLKSISMGDTSMTFADSNIGSFTALVSDLIHSKEGDLLCFRKLRW